MRGIVHRDLKPENILFNAKGEALLGDFGISTVLSTASVKYTQVAGTPTYMAPEQFRGEVCKESDQYALACIAYELLTGHKLFKAPDFLSMGYCHVHESPIPPRQLNAKVTGVTNLTQQQIIDIYAGIITNWKVVGGPDLPIVTVSRTAGSGTRVTFDTYVLNGGTEATGSSNVTANQSSDLSKAVTNTDGAIGYVTTFYAKQNKLTTIKINGVSDDDANVKNDSYKFWNIEHEYTKGAATALTQAFIDYMSSDSADVQSTRQSNGFLALSYLDPSAVATKQPK